MARAAAATGEIDREKLTSQSLEWLLDVAEAHARERTIRLLDASMAARAGQATTDGFKDFTRELKQQL